MYEELVHSLRICGDSADPIAECCYEDCIQHEYPIDTQCMQTLCKKAADAIEELSKPRWIPVTERLPECEQEVFICTAGKNSSLGFIVTTAFYEDGTMRQNDSAWCWEDIDYAGWDEEEDCGIIPEGWWEYRHFNPDDEYNNPVDRKVVAWMPLPEPPKEEK